MIACDFFTIETIWLKTLYVLFFIDLGTRRVFLAGCAATPNTMSVTQQARQMLERTQNGGYVPPTSQDDQHPRTALTDTFVASSRVLPGLA